MRALDIETIPNPEMIDRLPEPKPKYGNTKDPAKRAVIDADAKTAQIAGMGLNPLYGKVCAVAIHGEDYSQSICTEDELGMVAWAFENMGSRICTWNGNSFDMPFLYKRAMILKVPVPCAMGKWTKRYYCDMHCDLMEIFASWNPGSRESLDAVAHAVLGIKKPEYDYKLFPEMMKTVDGRAKIANDCLAHTTLTYKLYETMVGYLI